MAKRHRQHKPLALFVTEFVVHVASGTIGGVVLPYVDDLLRHARIDADRFERTPKTVEGFATLIKARVRGVPAWFIRRSYYLMQMPGWRR
jgi:hypothetical protein